MPSGKPLTKPYRPNMPPASQAQRAPLSPTTTLRLFLVCVGPLDSGRVSGHFVRSARFFYPPFFIPIAGQPPPCTFAYSLFITVPRRHYSHSFDPVIPFLYANMPYSSLLSCFALVLAIVAPVAAQTWTSCNPLNETNCPSDLALGMNYTYDFTKSSAGSTWNTTAGNILYGDNGAEFVINSRGDAPTTQTKFYIFFSVVEV